MCAGCYGVLFPAPGKHHGMATLFAGTSGFAYPTWKPGFYPPKLPAAKFLEHYASRLNCVEINYTFRRLPSGVDAARLGERARRPASSSW